MGAGKIGGMIAALLQGSGDYQIKVLDQSANALSALDVPHVTTEALDVSDLGKLTNALKGCDAVISAAPFFLTPVIAQAAKDADCHYLDLTEDVASTAEVEKIAKGANKAFAHSVALHPVLSPLPVMILQSSLTVWKTCICAWVPCPAIQPTNSSTI